MMQQEQEITRVERDGFEFVAYWQDDPYHTPHDMDCPPTAEDGTEAMRFWEERLADFGEGYWGYGGVVVEALLILGYGVNDTRPKVGYASIWGVESDCVEHIENDLIPELIDDALIDARSNLQKLFAAVQTLKEV